MKKKIFRNIIESKLLTIFICIVLFIVVYIFFHPTHLKYNDRWIMGKTAEQIEKRYGEFDFKFACYSGYKINRNFGEMITSDYFDHRYKEVYYYVEFGADGKVCRIDRGPNPRVWI